METLKYSNTDGVVERVRIVGKKSRQLPRDGALLEGNGIKGTIKPSNRADV